jgi:kinesin family protein 6/9
MVLRDSLGGNCKTKMIATINPSASDLYESLSTCRFSERVAKIKNDAQKNQVADPAIIIQRLKKENAELKAEIALLKGGNQKDHLEPEDIDECRKLVDEFIASKDPSATIPLADKLKINQCFYHFKHIYLDLKKRGGGQVEAAPSKNTDELTNEIQRLKMLVKQRDNEIIILVNLLNKRKAGGDVENTYVKLSNTQEEEKVPTTTSEYKPVVFSSHSNETTNVESAGRIVAESLHCVEEKKSAGSMIRAFENIRPEDLMDRTKAFEMFRKSYRRNEATEDNKAILKKKFEQGKRLGQEINQAREKVQKLTNQLESLRTDNALRGMVDKNGEIIRTPEEEKLLNEIAVTKNASQKQYYELKELKAEIENIQAMLKRSAERMAKDFEQWFTMMLKQYQGVHAGPKSTYSNASDASRIKDPKVNESLSAFYKARDEIYEKVSKNEKYN